MGGEYGVLKIFFQAAGVLTKKVKNFEILKILKNFSGRGEGSWGGGAEGF